MHLVINGFGRIGRTVLRQYLSLPASEQPESIWVNDIAPLETCAYLFRYDSVFGPYRGHVGTSRDGITIGDRNIRFTREPNLSHLDLSGIDLVMECTGKAQTRDIAERGLKAGAGAVLISGPSPAADETIVLGANDEKLTAQKIVSNASCTTNALAPLLRGLDDEIGIAAGHMTTIHCYTGSQPMVDAPRDTLERSRAGGVSMVPTTTSATTLVGEVLPQLKDRITGAAVRVPAISVSAVDLVLTFAKPVSDTFNDTLQSIFAGSRIVGFTNDPVVSTDMRARPESLIIQLPETLTCGDRQVRIFGWYDNEWGFSARMLDMAKRMTCR